MSSFSKSSSINSVSSYNGKSSNLTPKISCNLKIKKTLLMSKKDGSSLKSNTRYYYSTFDSDKDSFSDYSYIGKREYDYELENWKFTDSDKKQKEEN